MTAVLTQEQVTSTVDYWRNALGLSDWQIIQKIEDPPSEDGQLHLMSVNRHSKYKDAVLYVAPYVIGEVPWPEGVLEEHLAIDAEFYEYKIVHELLHLAVRDLIFVSVDALEGMLHRDVHQIHDEHATLEEERFVDHLAKALVNRFSYLRKCVAD